MFGRYLTAGRPGGGAGFGFRGSTPPYPYVGRGRGGLPRCSYYLGNQVNTADRSLSREQEIDFLKSQAENIRKELDAIESKINDLEASK